MQGFDKHLVIFLNKFYKLIVQEHTVKILKIRTPEKFAVITLKFEHGGFTI